MTAFFIISDDVKPAVLDKTAEAAGRKSAPVTARRGNKRYIVITEDQARDVLLQDIEDETGEVTLKNITTGRPLKKRRSVQYHFLASWFVS